LGGTITHTKACSFWRSIAFALHLLQIEGHLPQARVRVGNRELTASAGVCPSWFPRSRKVHIEWEEFQAAWCEGGVVARAALSAPGGLCPLHSLHFLLDASTV
jgi:hypothetical protein